MKTSTGVKRDIHMLLFSIVLFLLLIILMSTSGCRHEPVLPENVALTGTTNNSNGADNGNTYTENTCNPDTVYFANDILPLFISNCAKSGCHDAASHQDGIILDSYANIMNTGDIEAGDPSSGDVVEVITESDPDDRMPPPPRDRLSAEQINDIITWINQGALNNSCSGHCDTVLVTYNLTVAPLLRTRCVGCHNTTTTSGQINLSDYNGVYAVASNGRLMHAINHDPGFSPMPKGGAKMPACEIAEIRIWVNGGAPNN